MSSVASVLSPPVDRFVRVLTPVVERLAGNTPGVRADRGQTDVSLEALNIVSAFIEVDGRQTDEELWALIATFGPRFQTMLQLSTPDDLRKTGLIHDKRAWLATCSTLFDILINDDRIHGTANSWSYYELAMSIAHTICSIDNVPAEAEIRALERYRTMLVRAMQSAGIKQPTGLPVSPQLSNEGEPSDAAAAAAKAIAELPPPRPIAELLAELDELVGLKAVKDEVKLVANLIQIENLRKERGLPIADQSRHLVFTGNPGTGKTTVARMLAQIYRTLGVVEKGHLVESDRSGLVAGFVGQTAIQVKQVLESAIGGVLLIDEAYALARGDERDFGQEAIDTIVKLIEDHRDEVVVIAAGYPDEMHTFIESNPGLRSRFPKTIFFPDYTDDELVAIFESLCKKAAYKLTDAGLDELRAWFKAQTA